jgi:hypothetical protein
MALSGLVDAIIWSSTILFMPDEEKKNIGLDHFQFILPSGNQKFGNTVYIQGGRGDNAEDGTERRVRHKRGWSFGRGRRHSSSTEELNVIGGGERQHQGIQMDQIVTVSVEEDNNAWKRQVPGEEIKELEL